MALKKVYSLECLVAPELGTFQSGRVYKATSSGIRFSIIDDNGRKIPLRNDITFTPHVWDYFREISVKTLDKKQQVQSKKVV